MNRWIALWRDPIVKIRKISVDRGNIFVKSQFQTRAADLGGISLCRRWKASLKDYNKSNKPYHNLKIWLLE